MTFPNVLWRHGPQWHHAVRALEDKYFARLVPGLAVNLFFVVPGSFLRSSISNFCTAIVLVPAALETICVKSLLWPLRPALRRRLSKRANGISRADLMDGTFSQVVDEILIHESFPEWEYRHMKLATSSVREYLAGRTLGDITLVRWQHLARECSSVSARSALSST